MTPTTPLPPPRYSFLWATVGIQLGFIIACSAVIVWSSAKLNFQRQVVLQ